MLNEENIIGMELRGLMLSIRKMNLADSSRMGFGGGRVFLRSGIGLPEGRFPCHGPERAIRVSLRSEDGSLQPCTITPLAKWNDGSVKWGLLETILDTRIDHSFELVKEDVPNIWNSQSDSCELSVQSDGVLVFQGNGAIKSKIQIDPMVSDERASVVWSNPPTRRDSSWGFLWELNGTISQEGQARPIHFSMNFEWIPIVGLGLVKLQITNQNLASHPNGNWDLGNSGSVYFNDLRFQFNWSHHDNSSGEAICWLHEDLDLAPNVSKSGIQLKQVSSGGANRNSSNHINARRQNHRKEFGYVCEFDGYRKTGSRARPLGGVISDSHKVCIAPKKFWQNFPSAISLAPGSVEYSCWSSEFGESVELQGGEQKTYEFALTFEAIQASGSTKDLPLALLSYAEDWHLVANNDAFLNTRIIRDLDFDLGSDGSDTLYNSLVRQAISGEDSFFQKREKIDEYGWRNYGDVYGDHEAVFHKGPTPLISHYNNQYDCTLGFFYQFIRSGDARWYELMISMANHAWDIDTYHTTDDKVLYNGGLFWHTYHYADADTGTHRSYPRSLLNEDHFTSGTDLKDLGSTGNKLKKVYGKGGGPAASHNYSTGWMYAYYLTGDKRYREASINAADYVIRIEDGSKTPFRWLSRQATGYATCSSEGYYGPGRASGNSTHALLTGHEITGDQKYLDMAVRLMERTVHPEQDLETLDLLNAELRWFYTMYLQSLCRMIDVLEQTKGYERSFQYAVATLLHYARWMVKNERPILDHPERLQYPTETWAAQDIRKWHVLAYAAHWCPTKEEGRAMMERADWFYEYVMRTLDQFETKSLCRPVVLLLNFGWQRNGLRQRFERECPVGMVIDSRWPRFKIFIPQKQIAIKRAKAVLFAALTMVGLCAACLLILYIMTSEF